MTPTTPISTTDGDVQGTELHGVQVFYGLRYAAPPVGPRRFLPPEAPEPWAGTYDATTPKARAPQFDPPVNDMYGGPGPGEVSEDCLFLNVYTPAADSGARPVMVWIHGGSLQIGAANEFDGSILAKQGDVVVVTINYRLGLLGFLDLSRFGPEYADSAGLGHLDQIAALQWVRDRVTDYGGDPDNVTIFGESAGGASVRALLAAPRADGLYQRAAALSPGGQVEPALDLIEPLCHVLQVSEDQLVSTLTGMPAMEVAALGPQVGFFGIGPLDGRVVTRSVPAAIRDRGAQGVPVLAGYCRDEGRGMVTFEEDALPGVPVTLDSFTTRIVGALPAGGGDPTDYLQALRTRHPDVEERELSMMVWTDAFCQAACEMAEAASDAGPGGWLYRFDIASPARGGALGAAHGIDLPFIFNEFEQLPFLFTRQDTSDDRIQLMAKQWSNMLIAFARTGVPRIDAVADWAPYSAAHRTCLVFGPDTHVEADPAPGSMHRDLWEEARSVRARQSSPLIGI